MNEIMIEARGITKSYGQVTVLSGVDLDIEKHKITSISGASGAGKTTLHRSSAPSMPPMRVPSPSAEPGWTD